MGQGFGYQRFGREYQGGTVRLITIPMSHYCEKARWALERAGIEYQEDAHLQVFHYLAVKPHSDLGMVPVLVTEKASVCESSNILKRVDQFLPPEQRLYPEGQLAEVQALEQRFDQQLGVETRRWAYHHWKKAGLLNVLEIASQGTPKWQRLLAPLLFPFMLVYVGRILSVSADNVNTGVGIIQQEFDYVASLLSDGRPYLCGEKFTAADLSFACMAAPVVLPTEYGIRLPTYSQAPEAAKPDIRRFTAHPAGQFALSLFAQTRH